MKTSIPAMHQHKELSLFKSQLPVPATPILGRKKEVKELSELLKKHRILTITGAGGIGKTRLSIEICNGVKQKFQDGIFFVSMATLNDAKEVMPTLADSLGVAEAATRNLADGVSNVLSDKKVLLVLDNLEHVISASNEISDLMAKCPNLSILCTSRTPLKIRAEYEYALPPLSLPTTVDVDTLLEYSAVELFVNCAKKVNRDFELSQENAHEITEICRRIDGLPLALELAAARLRILSPKQLLQHLSKALDLLTTGAKDAPMRHQTLRAAIDWSYTLLNETECQLFRRLSVFAKGFSLQAVQRVCYEPASNPYVAINEIESLVEKGLVERMGTTGRFTLLQTIKDFATEKLVAAKEDEFIADKHAQYFSAFAKYIGEGAEGQQQNKRMREGIAEEANTSVALDYLLERTKKGGAKAREMGLGICSELWMYWHIRGKHKYGATYINSFLEGTDDSQPSLHKCGALFCLKVSMLTLGDGDQSLAAATRSYQMAKVLKDELAISKGLIAMSFGHLHLDPQVAVNYSNDAVTSCRVLGMKYWLALALWQNGLLHLIMGNLEIAKASYTESFLLFQEMGDNEGKGCAQSGLSMLEFIAGNYEQALELYQDTLAAFQAVGDRPEEARISYEMSWAYLAIKNTETALAQILASIQAYKEVGSNRGIGLSMNGLAAIEAVRGNHKNAVAIAAAAQAFAQQEGIAVEFGVSNHGKVYLDNSKKKLSKKEKEEAEKVGNTYSLKDVLKMVQQDTNTVESESSEDIFIKKLQAVIEANLDDADFGVNQLYEAVSMSQMQVYRKLKSLINQTPSEFIRLYRLEKGRELLKTTDQTVAEVAYNVGFTDPNYFSRTFQKSYNQSPSEYRK